MILSSIIKELKGIQVFNPLERSILKRLEMIAQLHFYLRLLALFTRIWVRQQFLDHNYISVLILIGKQGGDVSCQFDLEEMVHYLLNQLFGVDIGAWLLVQHDDEDFEGSDEGYFVLEVEDELRQLLRIFA